MTTSSPAASSSVAIDEKHASPTEEVKPPMACLSEQEREIIERQIDAPKLTIGYFALFRYASRVEVLIMIVALVASIAAGATMPLMTVVYGNFAGSFTNFSVDAAAVREFENKINTLTLYFVYLGMPNLLLS
jgi:ATP-binding cassette subfamily B (MDR/TAP) protein 1